MFSCVCSHSGSTASRSRPRFSVRNTQSLWRNTICPTWTGVRRSSPGERTRTCDLCGRAGREVRTGSRWFRDGEETVLQLWHRSVFYVPAVKRSSRVWWGRHSGEDIQGIQGNTFKVAPKQGIKEQAEMPDTHTHANTHTHTHAHKSTQPHHKKQLETEIPILYKLCAYTFMRKGFVFRCLDDAVTCHLKDLWPTTPFVLKRTVVFHADIWRLTYYPTKHKP